MSNNLYVIIGVSAALLITSSFVYFTTQKDTGNEGTTLPNRERVSTTDSERDFYEQLERERESDDPYEGLDIQKDDNNNRISRLSADDEEGFKGGSKKSRSNKKKYRKNKTSKKTKKIKKNKKSLKNKKN